MKIGFKSLKYKWPIIIFVNYLSDGYVYTVIILLYPFQSGVERGKERHGKDVREEKQKGRAGPRNCGAQLQVW